MFTDNLGTVFVTDAVHQKRNAVVGSVVTSFTIATGFLLFGFGNGSCLWTLIIALAHVTAS
jgi:hypothetical protein